MKKLSILCSLILCTSCSAQPSINTNPTQLSKATISKKQCAAHAFLTRYNCSVASIEKKAEDGDPNAAYALGYIYYYGIGIKADQQSAKLWIERAANLQQPLATQALQILGFNKKANLRAQHTSVTQNTPAKAINTAPKLLAQHIRHPDTPLSTLSMVVRHPKPLKTPRQTTTYTIQLAASHNKAPLLQLANSYHIPHKHIGRHTHKGVKWYTLTTGRYHTLDAAYENINNLPRSIQSMHPWVRKTNV